MCNWLKVATVLTLIASAAPAPADIFRRDNGQLIPGTEGITPGPGVRLDHRELEYAQLSGLDLNNSHFDSSNLTWADLRQSNLTNSDLFRANLTRANLDSATLANAYLYGANLTSANLENSWLANANLSGAVVTRADFFQTTSRGFTKSQLESTASYQAKNLQSIGLGANDLTGWDFRGQHMTYSSLANSTLANANLTEANLTNANLNFSNLTNANLTGVNLTSASLYYSTLTNANLTGAVVTGADFRQTTSRGFTKAHLESTASFQANDLQGILLSSNDLTGWDFNGQNLTGASFSSSTLTNADLTGAVITRASFSDTTLRGFTKAQFESTASYQAKNLQGIGLEFNDLTGWDFSGQDLSNARLASSTLTNANLTGAVVAGAHFDESTSRGFTKSQLESTVSYHAQNLQGIRLRYNDLTGWDFSGQNLSRAYLDYSTLTNANLASADLSSSTLINANLTGTNLTSAGLKYSTLTDANLTGAVVTGTDFSGTTLYGFTKEQLYSTASYKSKNLHGIRLELNDLSGWDFNGQNLTNADLSLSTLTNVNLSGAVVTGADFGGTTSGSFTKEQLYSTASYRANVLAGIRLSGNDLSGWNFNGQNLTDARLSFSTLTNADLSGANLANAYLGYSTLTNADLSEANLANAELWNPTLTDTDLTFADMRGAYSYTSLNLNGAISANTILPGGNIVGFNMSADDHLLIRNYHGDPNRGLGPIPITVQDQLTISDGGIIQILFDAEVWHSMISFQPNIPVTLGGILELAFADDVAVAEQSGRTFDIFNWTGVVPSGAFVVDSDYLWDLTNLHTTGEITLLSSLTGDANGDGQVSLEDLNLVRNNFGSTGDLGLPGDVIPFDGVVDLQDLNAVRNHFGASSVRAVPEPTGVVLLASAILAAVAVQMMLQSRSSAITEGRDMSNWLRAVAMLGLLSSAECASADIFRWDNGQLIPGTEGITLGSSLRMSGWNTASRNLRYGDLSNANLRHSLFLSVWLEHAHFIESDLANSSFLEVKLGGADFQYASLEGVFFAGSDLTGANFDGADLTPEGKVGGALFSTSTLSADQLYSTLSYQDGDLHGVSFVDMDLGGWSFRGQHLEGARFAFSKLVATDFQGAHISDLLNGASFEGTTALGFTAAQLYSTASYGARNLQSIQLSNNDLNGWAFDQQNLRFAHIVRSTAAFAKFDASNLIGADLSGSQFSHASFTDANLSEADLSDSDFSAVVMRRAYLGRADLRGAVFDGADLSDAYLCRSVLTSVSMRGAQLNRADLRGTSLSDLSQVASSRNTILHDGSIHGLVMEQDETLVVRNDNVRHPFNAIALSVKNEMSLLATSTLKLEFDVSDWKSSIAFQFGIPVSLDGTLELTFAEGVFPARQTGRSVRIFDWTGVSPTGAFNVESDYLWDLSNLYTTGEITLLSALTGDADGDGQVSLEDLNLVRNNFGSTGEPGLPGDVIPFDGIVDLLDLNAVRNNFGESSVRAVPEPSGVVLLACAMVTAAIVSSVIANRQFDAKTANRMQRS